MTQLRRRDCNRSLSLWVPGQILISFLMHRIKGATEMADKKPAAKPAAKKETAAKSTKAKPAAKPAKKK